MTKQNNQMPEGTLLFIPDISGFTDFVTNTAIQHSQHIIEELLEILIDSNELDMKVSEIEGDAILFYREGEAPSSAEMLSQVQRMYIDFHAHLKKYEHHRICQCGACSTANNLAIKFFGHYGEVAKKHVKNHEKLFGRDVILIHRLMKNNIKGKEYGLFTEDLTSFCANWEGIKQEAWAVPSMAEEEYDAGKVRYCHLDLSPLYDRVPEPQAIDFAIPGLDVKFMESEKVVEAPIDLVFDVISDLTYRHHWITSLKGGDNYNHKITQPGATHRCIIKNDESDPLFVAHDFEISQDLITFVETNKKEGYRNIFFLRAIGTQQTKVESIYFWKPNFIKKIMFSLMMKKKLLKMQDQNLNNLNDYCKKLFNEGKRHENRIELGISSNG